MAFLARSLSPAAAQDKSDAPPQPDLRALRVDYRKSLLEALLPQKKAYRDELENLEKKFAVESDFVSAMRARDERSQLDQEIMAMEQELPALASQAQALHSPALPERITLSPTDAQLTGVTMDAKAKTLTGWRPARSLATWKVPPLPLGGYEVYITYTCPGKAGAAFTLRESHYSLQCKVTEPSPKAVEKLFGTLRVQTGSSTLSLSADSVETDQPIQIHAVALVPANR